MKIKESVLERLDNNRGYALIMLALDCAHTTARRLVEQNLPDSDLTKASALEMMRKEFELTDNEILEKESTLKEATK